MRKYYIGIFIVLFCSRLLGQQHFAKEFSASIGFSTGGLNFTGHYHFTGFDEARAGLSFFRSGSKQTVIGIVSQHHRLLTLDYAKGFKPLPRLTFYLGPGFTLGYKETTGDTDKTFVSALHILAEPEWAVRPRFSLWIRFEYFWDFVNLTAWNPPGLGGVRLYF